MAVTAVVFDVGETLVDETRIAERDADACGVPRFTLMALAGVAIERGEAPQSVFGWLGLTRPEPVPFGEEDLYPDALPCIRALRGRGLRVGAAGNMAMVHQAFIEPHVDFVGSSELWGVQKPSHEFFMRLVDALDCAPSEIAYVGDRVDNDVLPAKRAGMTAVHVRRGPWGLTQDGSAADLVVDSLADLPEALA